jgi:hypothetical protein
VSARGVDHVASRGAGQIGVVEHHTPGARGELVLQRVRELAEGSPAFVAVQPDETPRDVVLGHAALPGSRDAHDEDDVGVVSRTRALGGSRARPAECDRQGTPLLAVQTEARGGGGRARGLGATRAGDGDHGRGQVEQPRKRDLGRRRAARSGDVHELMLAPDRPRTARSSERRVRDQRDSGLDAPLHDSAADRTIVEDAERDLDR